MTIFFKYHTDIEEIGQHARMVYRLYGYFDYEGNYYKASFNIPDVHYSEDTDSQIRSLLSNEDNFCEILREGVIQCINEGNTIPYYKFMEYTCNTLFAYTIEF